MPRSHNKGYQPRSRKKNKVLQSGSEFEDTESQTSLAAPPQHDFVLLIYGFHAFCAVSLYSTPYAVMQGGWVGLMFLVLHFVANFVSAFQMAEILSAYPQLRTFSDVGRQAFGDYGGLSVCASDFLLILASCVESVMISYAAIDHASPVWLTTFINQRSTLEKGIIWVIVIALMALFCNLVDVGPIEIFLTGLGSILNIVIVGCLLWLYLFNSYVPSKSTRKSVDYQHMPMANALFALCFAGHTTLPRIYNRMRQRNDVRYIRMILTMFIASFLLYALTAIIGYRLFGADVKSIYVLNMPMELLVSKVAIGTMVTHQFVRYIMGINDLVTMLTAGVTEHRRAWIVFYTCLLVIVTIPLAIFAPFYSTVMAFVGSILGIQVSLIIPPACSIRIMWLQMETTERILMFVILMMGILALVASVWSLVW